MHFLCQEGWQHAPNKRCALNNEVRLITQFYGSFALLHFVCTQNIWRVTRSHSGFSLEIYLQMVRDTIGRYETPSLRTAIEMLSRQHAPNK